MMVLGVSQVFRDELVMQSERKLGLVRMQTRSVAMAN